MILLGKTGPNSQRKDAFAYAKAMVIKMKEMICITCPKGCHLQIDEESLKVTGNGCPRGVVYAQNELTNPKRTVTSTVAIRNSFLPRCPVRTSAPIPKGKTEELMSLLKNCTLNSPVKRGDIVLANIFDSGADVIVTRDM